MAGLTTTVKLSEEAKGLWKSLSETEGRSMAGYLERILIRERDRGLMTDASALDVIADRLMVISNRLEELSMYEKRKVKKSSEPKKSPLDVDLKGVVTEESWKNWIAHLRLSNFYPTEHQANNMINLLVVHDDDGWDCNDLLEYLSEHNAKSIYIPFEWQRENAK